MKKSIFAAVAVFCAFNASAQSVSSNESLHFIGNYRVMEYRPAHLDGTGGDGKVVRRPAGWYSKARSLTLEQYFSTRLNIPGEYLVVKGGLSPNSFAAVSVKKDNAWYEQNKNRFPSRANKSRITLNSDASIGASKPTPSNLNFANKYPDIHYQNKPQINKPKHINMRGH